MDAGFRLVQLGDRVMFRAGLHNFSKGELGPQLYGRVDIASYSAAVRLARNVVVLKYGGLQRRMGTRLVYELKQPAAGWDDPSAAARLIPFEFSIEQTYVLLMTQAAMRPLALGGAVLEEELAITAITNEAAAKITIAWHAYVVGEEIFLSGISGPMGAFLNGRSWTVTAVVDANNFRINADTSQLAAFTAATGGITRAGPPAGPPAAPPVPPVYNNPSPPAVYDPGSYNWRRDGFEGGRYL